MKTATNIIATWGLALLISLSAVASNGSGSADSLCEKTEQRLIIAIQMADAVFKGRVVAVGPPPPFESGVFAATQDVSFIVQDVLLGKLEKGSRIDVRYTVVNNSVNSEPGKNRLSEQRFRLGNSLIVIARNLGTMLIDVDEDYGTFEYSMENEQWLKKLIAHCRKGNG